MGICLLGAAPPVMAQGAGSTPVTVCLPCHGPAASEASAGSGPAAFPRLDGQQAVYLEKQLREYKSGKRTSTVMAPLMNALKKDQFGAVASHFATQAPARGAVESPELAARGKALYEGGNHTSGVPACVGCHQAGAVGYGRYPRLAGQRQAYTVQQLTQFKTGTRNNDRAHVMRALAGRLTEDEIRAVAEYLAGLQ